MTEAERYDRVTTLFADALDRATADRAAWLADACDDTGVRQEVAAMLAHHTGAASGLLDAPLLDREDPPDPLIGTTVGPWRVVALLGRGGMGTVYHAERADADGPEGFRQSAALKLVRPGIGRDFRARFLRERALLASLDHPGIARLLDGGVTPEGTPYLAMELVEGEPITTYADARGLDVPARLALFLDACAAVAYAHRRLVVHRDLKPEHVLMSGGMRDGEGIGDEEHSSLHPSSSRVPHPSVKLLDFGVAKLLGETDDALTQTGAGPLTPAYAAPEQLLGQPVTTATDVYALGVVLYELLAGRRPYDLTGQTAAGTERLVTEILPKRPSEVAPADRARPLRGDLDAVVLKALAKEPERRYASADALADDLRRHLSGTPVDARAATAAYRAGRFVRRHRAGVLAAALVALAVLGGATVAILGERDARQAQAEAEEQAERAEAIAGFLEGILRAPNSRWYVEAETTGPETPIRVVLDEAARRVETEFADRPDLRADLHHVLGDTYLSLGLADRTAYHHRAALALRESLYTAPHPAVAEALYYASGYLDPDDLQVELNALRRAAEMLRQSPGGNNFPFILQELADFHLALGQPEEARRLAREGLAFVDATFVPGHDGHRYRDRILPMLAAEGAHAALDLGEPHEAARWIATADSARRVAGLREHDRLALARGRLLMTQGRTAEAEPLLLASRGERPFRRGGRAVLEDFQMARASTALAALYDATGRPTLAEQERQRIAPHLASRDSLRRAVR